MPPVVVPVVVDERLVGVTVEVQDVAVVDDQAGNAQTAFACHQVQTRPNLVFYMRYISQADRTECSIFCLRATRHS